MNVQWGRKPYTDGLYFFWCEGMGKAVFRSSIPDHYDRVFIVRVSIADEERSASITCLDDDDDRWEIYMYDLMDNHLIPWFAIFDYPLTPRKAQEQYRQQRIGELEAELTKLKGSA